MDGRETPGKVRESGGGVARNVADALGKLGLDPFLITAVGDDSFGKFVLDGTLAHLNQKGVEKLKNSDTGVCMVLCDHSGECLLIVGDMDIHRCISKTQIQRHEAKIAESSLVVLDGNLSQEATEFVLDLCHRFQVPVWFEPTDVVPSSKPFIGNKISRPTFISPNIKEFRRIYETFHPEEKEEDSRRTPTLVEECADKGCRMARTLENIIVTLGKEGVMVIRRGKASEPFFSKGKKPKYLPGGGPITWRLYKPQELNEEELVNVSGAGDCFASGFIAAMLKGEDEESCVRLGFRCSRASLLSPTTVPLKF